MEVENRVLEDVLLVSQWAIFHFHIMGGRVTSIGPHLEIFTAIPWKSFSERLERSKCDQQMFVSLFMGFKWKSFMGHFGCWRYHMFISNQRFPYAILIRTWHHKSFGNHLFNVYGLPKVGGCPRWRVKLGTRLGLLGNRKSWDPLDWSVPP